MAHPSQTEIRCSICNKPVDLKTTKTDDNGRAVHAECYTTTVTAKQPTPIRLEPAS
jgi:hypothetical protein